MAVDTVRKPRETINSINGVGRAGIVADTEVQGVGKATRLRLE